MNNSLTSIADFLSRAGGEAQITSLVDIALQQPALLDDLWQFGTSGNKGAWKAIWVMDKLHDLRPELIRPYLMPMLENVEQMHQSGQKRHMLKLLSLNSLPCIPTGRFIDFCFNLLLSKSEPAAIRVHAMQLLYNISKEIPEFQQELRIVIEDVLVEGTPGIKTRGRKILQSF